ncbi:MULTISPECIES: GNAT family N-acetyltransferase [Rhodopseudomonas]|nr:MULTISPECIES: GNAT family N-acetyltransferase [Rhodopseudomonas]MDF3808807.1 GNAT family N-acetyltransferase [Rhodopseudomonas sp. BAL398]WOK20620.1 GNAT family N-acetyltransferase [Rhodopseudomonas sp. BAL398]
MTATLIESPTVDANASLSASSLSASSSPRIRIARVDIIRDLAAAEPIWRALEQPEQLSTPYQRFDLLSAWQRYVGASEALTPFIVVASDAESRPLLLLPLALQRRRGVGIARFLGGKHTTFNMPLWRRDFAQSASSADIHTLIELLRDQAGGADVLALTQQPLRWRGQPNPMALLPHQDSVNDCPVLTMPPDAPATSLVSNSFRRRLKGKERKLQALAGYRYCVAGDQPDITRLLDAFFKTKPLRMAAQNLPNVFADPGVADFIRTSCSVALTNGGRAIDIHALECDDEVIALFAGVDDGHRFSMMFNTYTLSENARYSPGLILMRHIIDHFAARGYGALDLGIGSDDYKLLFCKDLEPVFDSYIGLNMRGSIAAGALASFARAKRMVKQTPALMQFAQRLRTALRRSDAPNRAASEAD